MWCLRAATRWACQAPPRAPNGGGRAEDPPSLRAGSEPVPEQSRAETERRERTLPAGTARRSRAATRFQEPPAPGADPGPENDPPSANPGPESDPARARTLAPESGLARLARPGYWPLGMDGARSPCECRDPRPPPLCARRAAAAPSPRAPPAPRAASFVEPPPGRCLPVPRPPYPLCSLSWGPQGQTPRTAEPSGHPRRSPSPGLPLQLAPRSPGTLQQAPFLGAPGTAQQAPSVAGA
ncbi:basic proline-rich protein-like [Talpa occidentalis]|uniref:basic proline-rich protein-like n=1 Tax=Talpa occidentalis TaxID=50954 RepID=UPI0023F900F2|nr:basic proline-rich protein-like [Talpa occidentalis]